MRYLDLFHSLAHEMPPIAAASAGSLPILHAISAVAVGLTLLALAVHVGYRLGSRRAPRLARSAFFADGSETEDAAASGAMLDDAFALEEAEREIEALQSRILDLEETSGLFAQLPDHVRAPRLFVPMTALERAELAAADLSFHVRARALETDDIERGGAAGAEDRYTEPAREPSEMSTEHEPSRPRVLVVEDNRDLNRFLCRCLGHEFDVLSAKNGAEGLEVALRERPDCVLTDVMMPIMGGEQLVTALRSRPELEGIPVVVLTARDDDQLRIKLLKEGVQDFITKPFLTDEVLARVRNLVAAKRAADVLSEQLATKRMDLETMAREVTRHRHELQTALQQMQVARDIAERASSVKSNFLRMMSHELRTPIAAMQLQLRLMEKHGADKLEDKQREYLARISRSAQRLLDLVNTVLEYARIESGRFEARVRPFSLTKVLQEAADDFQSHADQKGIRLSVELPDDVPELLSDPQVVRLIAVNLIGNGVKHTEEGSVCVGGGFEDGVHTLWVKDTGPGIPREHQMEVFEPFQRFDDIRQLQGAGSGLGLAIVRDMVRAVAGEISLESEVGAGALFRVTLPMLPSGDDDKSRSASFVNH